MKKQLFAFILAFLLCFNFNVYALDLSAKSAVVMDFLTKDVLYEKNAHQRLSMASTTKIMTALCAIENGKLDEIVTIDKRAVGVEGSSMYLTYNEKISLENLIYGLMLSSGNDAAVAIALHISGSIEGFAELMNKTAQKIGAVNTSFKNPNGLDAEGHYTTAYDLALITANAMQNEKFCEIVATVQKKIPKSEQNHERYLRNHNKMLVLYDGCTGVKTGFTKKSGRCLVSSAKRDNFSVIAVTLSAPNDWSDHTKMLNFAFDNYKAVKIVEKGSYIQGINVEKGSFPFVKLTAKDDIYITAKKNEQVNYDITYKLDENVNAPVYFGKIYGEITITSNGKEYKTSAVADNSISVKITDKEKYINNLKKIISSWAKGFI